MQPVKKLPVRKVVCLCAAVVLLLGMATVCYAADVGGIQRTVQLWVRGEQTTAVMDIQNGEYHLTYEDADGVTHERGGGGIAYEWNGTQRELTEEELMENLNFPEVDEREDGSVWFYYKDQVMEITDRFNEDDVCFLQLKDGEETLYVTIKLGAGLAMSPKAFVQPDTIR